MVGEIFPGCHMDILIRMGIEVADQGHGHNQAQGRCSQDRKKKRVIKKRTKENIAC